MYAYIWEILSFLIVINGEGLSSDLNTVKQQRTEQMYYDQSAHFSSPHISFYTGECLIKESK